MDGIGSLQVADLSQIGFIEHLLLLKFQGPLLKPKLFAGLLCQAYPSRAQLGVRAEGVAFLERAEQLEIPGIGNHRVLAFIARRPTHRPRHFGCGCPIVLLVRRGLA